MRDERVSRLLVGLHALAVEAGYVWDGDRWVAPLLSAGQVAGCPGFESSGGGQERRNPEMDAVLRAGLGQAAGGGLGTPFPPSQALQAGLVPVSHGAPDRSSRNFLTSPDDHNLNAQRSRRSVL